MRHKLSPIPFKPSRLIGMSERLLASHYENDYGGIVRRLNAIEARLTALDWSKAPAFEIDGLTRGRSIATNAMVLHEVYFDGLGGADGLGGPAVEPAGPLAEAIGRDFGGMAAWRAQFAAIGRALVGGSAWVVLAWAPRQGRLVNFAAGDHAPVPADSVPLLALDLAEHAYHLDFGADTGAYVDAWFENLHWQRPARRFADAGGLDAMRGRPADRRDPLAAEDLRELLERGEVPLLLDICLAEDVAKRRDKLPGAKLLAPERLADWIDTLPKDRPIVAYCVYGYQVSGDAVSELQRRGYAARKLAGGIAAWHALGGATEPLS